MGQIESLLLSHSQRGMDLLYPLLPSDYCSRAAEMLLSLPRGTVLLTTGFCVAGRAETDGPAGTLCIALALRELGYEPVVVTDELCRGTFEPYGIPVHYMAVGASVADCRALLEELHPVALVSSERAGRGEDGDYANMRGISIRSKTAPCDMLFLLSSGHIPSVGIGDGGNEIGMGVLADVIREKLAIRPCVVKTDRLIIADVSDWGALGLCAALSAATGKDLLPTGEGLAAIRQHCAGLGHVDGVTHVPGAVTVDGWAPETEQALLAALHTAVFG